MTKVTGQIRVMVVESKAGSRRISSLSGVLTPTGAMLEASWVTGDKHRAQHSPPLVEASSKPVSPTLGVSSLVILGCSPWAASLVTKGRGRLDLGVCTCYKAFTGAFGSPDDIHNINTENIVGIFTKSNREQETVW